jgi:hypothetical protein
LVIVTRLAPLFPSTSLSSQSSKKEYVYFINSLQKLYYILNQWPSAFPISKRTICKNIVEYLVK